MLARRGRSSEGAAKAQLRSASECAVASLLIAHYVDEVLPGECVASVTQGFVAIATPKHSRHSSLEIEAKPGNRWSFGFGQSSWALVTDK